LDDQTLKAIANENIDKHLISCKTYDGIKELWNALEGSVKKILQRDITKNLLQEQKNAVSENTGTIPINSG
jgi:hypothetical protein